MVQTMGGVFACACAWIFRTLPVTRYSNTTTPKGEPPTIKRAIQKFGGDWHAHFMAPPEFSLMIVFVTATPQFGVVLTNAK